MFTLSRKRTFVNLGEQLRNSVILFPGEFYDSVIRGVRVVKTVCVVSSVPRAGPRCTLKWDASWPRPQSDQVWVICTCCICLKGTSCSPKRKLLFYGIYAWACGEVKRTVSQGSHWLSMACKRQLWTWYWLMPTNSSFLPANQNISFPHFARWERTTSNGSAQLKLLLWFSVACL